MTTTVSDAQNTTEPTTRLVGGTEYSWCKAVPGGTGITVLALLLTKPINISSLQSALNKLKSLHIILNSKLNYDTTTSNFSYITPSSTNTKIEIFDLLTTSKILSSNFSLEVSPYQYILEHEMNKNTWSLSPNNEDLFHVSLYTLNDSKWVLTLRLHTSICDRAAAVALLKELLILMGGNGDEIDVYKEEMGKKIEDCIPNGKSNKPFWLRGMDVVGYSLNSFRFSNLDFVDTNSSTRFSQVIRLQINSDDTFKVLEGCKSRGIKLSGALAAAGLIAVHSTKDLPENQWLKYAVVTLVDCRSILDPVLNGHTLGFYHSAILNTHNINGGDKLWEVAERCYESFTNAKNSNKHFTDMGDLNFLMCKAIDNPSLTPSASCRTACISVFEDSIIDEPNGLHEELGIEDYCGCASVHGIGPSIALFHTIRGGKLDCACVYPSPLHSREQMQKVIDDMKRILVESCVNDVKEES